MDFEYSVFLFLCLALGLGAEQGKTCERCIALKDCTAYGDMTRSEQNKWIQENACENPQREQQEDMTSLFGFAPFAKGDFICCPDSSNNNEELNKNRRRNRFQADSGSRSGQNGGIRRSENIRDGSRNFNNGNDSFNNNRFPTTNTNNNFNPISNTPNNNSNRRQNNFSQSPNSMWNNGRSNDGQGNNFNQRQTTAGNEGTVDDFLPGNNQSDRRFDTQTENPYFLAKTTQPNRRGNDNNSVSRGIPAANSNQCVVDVPPTLNSGCCGIDATADANRINGAQRSHPSRRSPNYNSNMPWTGNSNNQFGPSTPSLWPNWFPQPMNFFSEREKRENKNKTAEVAVDTRIIGGEVTLIGQYPWLVLVKTTFRYSDREEAFNCGGSIIASRYILTAGHCVTDEEAIDVSEIEVTIAEHDKRTYPKDCANTEEGRVCVQNMRIIVNKVIRHPDYDDTKLQNDIALLRLQSRVPYTEFIRPICLPPLDIDSTEFSNLPVHVAGWGRNGRFTSNIKQSTVVNLVPQKDCKRFYSFLTRRHLCAAGYSGEDTCKGDSGGPLMVLYQGKYFVSGIVSGKRADSPCGTSVPSLYTNVFHYNDWIMNNIN